MRRRVDGVLSAEPTQLRYFVDTNALGIIATRTHPLRAAYLALIAAEEFDDRTPSISTIVVNEVEAGLSTLDAGGPTAQRLAAAMRAVLDALDHMDLDDEGQTLADKSQIQARAAGHPLGAPAQRNDLIIASRAIRHHAPLISHNYRDFINRMDVVAPDWSPIATGTIVVAVIVAGSAGGSAALTRLIHSSGAIGTSDLGRCDEVGVTDRMATEHLPGWSRSTRSDTSTAMSRCCARPMPEIVPT